jgi:hypothetical protein
LGPIQCLDLRLLVDAEHHRLNDHPPGMNRRKGGIRTVPGIGREDRYGTGLRYRGLVRSELGHRVDPRWFLMGTSKNSGSARADQRDPLRQLE